MTNQPTGCVGVGVCGGGGGGGGWGGGAGSSVLFFACLYLHGYKQV